MYLQKEIVVLGIYSKEFLYNTKNLSFNALVEKVLGKKSSEYISREIESYSNKKRFVIVLRDEQLKTFLKAKALIATCKDKRIKDENISDLIMSGVLG